MFLCILKRLSDTGARLARKAPGIGITLESRFNLSSSKDLRTIVCLRSDLSEGRKLSMLSDFTLSNTDGTGCCLFSIAAELLAFLKAISESYSTKV